MNADTLERLLIDRAEGQLPPDVRELLDDHLQREPSARREAAEIDETLRLARLALADEKVVALPSPRKGWRIPTTAWPMAACFLGGLFLGLLTLPARSVNRPIAIAAPPQIVAAATPPIFTQNSSFWSVSRLRTESSTVLPRTDRVVWKSVFKKPEIL